VCVVRAPIGVAAMLSGKPKIKQLGLRDSAAAWAQRYAEGYQPRGRALGGSSAINGMIYIRGHHTDYDDWAALGCEGWSWKEVLPYFKRRKVTSAAPMFFMAVTARCASPTSAARGRSRQLLSKPARKPDPSQYRFQWT